MKRSQTQPNSTNKYKHFHKNYLIKGTTIFRESSKTFFKKYLFVLKKILNLQILSPAKFLFLINVHAVIGKKIF